MHIGEGEGGATFANFESQLAHAPIPLADLVEITGIAPDFPAVQNALELGQDSPLPFGYVELYSVAVRSVLAKRREAREAAYGKGDSFDPGRWLGDIAVRAGLAETLEPVARRLAIVNNLSRFFQRDDLPWRDYQQEAILKSLAFMTKGSNEILSVPTLEDERLLRYGYHDLPTGSGKTVAMALLALGMGIGTVVSDKYPRLLRGAIAGPTLNILGQTLGDYTRGFSRFAPSIQMARLDSFHKRLPAEWDMLGTSYQMLLRLLVDGRAKQYGIDALFLDEGHHALGAQIRRALLLGGIPIAIGFTATPDTNEERQLRKVLPNQLHSVDTVGLMERGDLSGIHVQTLGVGEKFDVSGFTREGEFLQSDLEELSDSPNINRLTRDIAVDFVTSGYQIGISCFPGDKCYHARYMAELLSNIEVTVGGETRFIVAKAIGDMAGPGGKKMSEDEKQEILADFEAGLIDVLTWVDYLDEGWDSTAIDGLILTNATASLRKEKQRVGRLARPKPGQPLKWLIEYSYDDTGQILASDALGHDFEAEFVIGTSKAYEFFARHRKQRQGRSAIATPKVDGIEKGGLEERFPGILDDIEAMLGQAEAVLLGRRRIEAAKAVERAPEDWPSFSELRQLRSDLTPKMVVGILRRNGDIYDAKIRTRSARGNNETWEIHYPPGAREVVVNYVVPDFATPVDISVNTAIETLGIGWQKGHRIIDGLADSGTITLRDLRIVASGRITPHLTEADFALLQAMAESEKITAVRVSVKALAVLLGRSPSVLKRQAENAGHTVDAMLSDGPGTRGDYIVEESVVALAEQHPRIPEVPSSDYKTEHQLSSMWGAGAAALAAVARDLSITPRTYVVRGRGDRLSQADFYSPAEITAMKTELDTRRARRSRPTVQAPAEDLEEEVSADLPVTVRTTAVAKEDSKQDEADALPPRQMVEQALERLLRNTEGKAYLPALTRHFAQTSREATDRPTPLDRRTGDMLHAMSLLYASQAKLWSGKRSDKSDDWAGPLAFRLLLGSRKDSVRPLDFAETYQEVRRMAARNKSAEPSEEQLLRSIAKELQKFIGAISTSS